ncbi:hypothetical protein GW17_00060821 [Ensete ventricosum]|nr:hypothetical protein GW17_00060821 [Ensete ventricosum]
MAVERWWRSKPASESEREKEKEKVMVMGFMVSIIEPWFYRMSVKLRRPFEHGSEINVLRCVASSRLRECFQVNICRQNPVK